MDGAMAAGQSMMRSENSVTLHSSDLDKGKR